MTSSSLEDLKEYLFIRKVRYKAGNNENEHVYLKLFKNEPKPLIKRAIENIAYKYTMFFDKRMSPHKLRYTYAAATSLAEQTNGDIPLIMLVNVQSNDF